MQHEKKFRKRSIRKIQKRERQSHIGTKSTQPLRASGLGIAGLKADLITR